MADNARQTGPALEAHRQFLKWLVPTVEKFPRSQKFMLGDRIQSAALDVLEALIDPLFPRSSRRFLEQQSRQPPRGPAQQQPTGQPQQQPGLPFGEHDYRQSWGDHGPLGCAFFVQGRS